MTSIEHPFQTTTSEFWNSYLKGRPKVPDSLWQRIWNYHKNHGNAKFDSVHDLGSGPGVHAQTLAQHLRKVTLTDPNAFNIKMAENYLAESEAATKFVYRIGRGEGIEVGGETFDMVVALNSLHWMDPAESLPAIASTLKPGGTFVAALFGFPDVLDERAETLVLDWFRHGINLILENGAPPLFEFSVLSQDSGYDCIEMNPEVWKAIHRVKINHQNEYKGFGGNVRKARRDISYAVNGSEEVIKEEDSDWYFKTDLHGLRDIAASFPFPNDLEYESKMWKELGEIYRDKPVEGLYHVDLLLAQKV